MKAKTLYGLKKAQKKHVFLSPQSDHFLKRMRELTVIER
jgi:hypothetical protein